MNEEFTVCLESTLRNNSKAIEFTVTPLPESTIGGLLLLALDRTGLKHKSDEAYGFSIDRNSTKILSIETKAHTLPTRRLHLRQIMVRISVYMTESQEEQIFGLSPLMTVNDAVLFMENAQFKGCDFDIMRDSILPRTPQHELLLITNASLTESSVTQGIPLEYNRTLRSYRISQADTMIVTGATAMGQRWQTVTGSMGSDLIPVLVHAPCFGLRKAMKVSPRSTFREVLDLFLEKSNQTVLSRFYTLCVEMGGEPGDMMNLDDQLDSYPLPTPARLQCVPAPRPAQVVFGVDPSGLPLVSDMGVQIPEVLVDLRDMLLLLDPFEEEGIFRKAGNENEMKRMIHNFNKGRPVESSDIHSVATLLKRWFKDLPKRVLASVSKDILQDEERLFRVWEELPPLESALAKWLFELLVDISRHSDKNMMVPNNMGIVFGPGLYGSSGALDTASRFAAMASLSGDSSTGCEIVERVLEHLLKHPDCRPLKPEPVQAPAFVPMIPNPAVLGGPGPMQPRGPVLIDLSGDSKMAQLLAKRRQIAEGNLPPATQDATVSAAPTPTAPTVPNPARPLPRALPQTAPKVSAASHPLPATPGGGAGATKSRIQSVKLPMGAVNMQDELKNRLHQRKSMALSGVPPGIPGKPTSQPSGATPPGPAGLRSTMSEDPRMGGSPHPPKPLAVKPPPKPPGARPLVPQEATPAPPPKPSIPPKPHTGAAPSRPMPTSRPLPGRPIPTPAPAPAPVSVPDPAPPSTPAPEPPAPVPTATPSVPSSAAPRVPPAQGPGSGTTPAALGMRRPPPTRRPAPALSRRQSSPATSLVRSKESNAEESGPSPPSPERAPPGPPQEPPSAGANLRRSLPSTSFVKKPLPAAPGGRAVSPQPQVPFKPMQPPSEPAPTPDASAVPIRPMKRNYPTTRPAPPPPADPESPRRDPPIPAESNTVLNNKPLPAPPQRGRPKSMFPMNVPPRPAPLPPKPSTNASLAGSTDRRAAPVRPVVPGGRAPPPPRGGDSNASKSLSRSVSEMNRGAVKQEPQLTLSKQKSTPTTQAFKLDTDSPRFEYDIEDDDDDDEAIMRELMDFVASERRCSDDLGFDSPPASPRKPALRQQSAPHTQLSPRPTTPPEEAPSMPPAHSVSAMTSLAPAEIVDTKPKRTRSVRFVKKKPPLTTSQEKVEDPSKVSKSNKRFSKFLGSKKAVPTPADAQDNSPVHIPTAGVKWGKSKDAEELFAKLKSEGFAL